MSDAERRQFDARADLLEAIHRYQVETGAPGAIGSWVLVTELSILDGDDPDDLIRHGYNYVTSPGTSPAAAICLLRIGTNYAEANSGLEGDDE